MVRALSRSWLALVLLSCSALPALAASLQGPIVFACDRSGRWDIWVMDADGSSPVNLTSDWVADDYPEFSRDGKKIVWTKGGRGPDGELWVMDADGSGKKQLTSDGYSDIGACWSPDGSQIAWRSQRKGNRYSVMVEVRVPLHHDLAVKKQKVIHDMHTQLPAIINEAFGAIETQLKRTVARRRGDAKQNNGQPHGMVEKLFAEEGYGFIRAVEDDRQFYFHRNSVLHGDFDHLAIGVEVRFSAEEGEKGPQASSVQLVSRPSGG